MMKRTFPYPAYPDGWFQVAYSDELAPGQILNLEYFGSALILFRDADGKPHVLDAYCAHLGAHLGIGGKIDDKGNVRCCFHGWKFDGGGACVEVPYAKKIPPKARVRSWPTRDVNGCIYVWHHAAGLAPTWELPVLPEVGDEAWTPFEKRRWKIRTRNQEMAENAVDSPHFHYVHGATNMPQSKAEVKGELLHVISTTGMSTPRGGIDGTVESMSYGFGCSVVRFKGLVETLLVQSTIPIDEEYVDVRFAFSLRKLPDKDVTRSVGGAFVREVTRQLEQDIPIWENKVYYDKPVLCDGDGPIALFRRWCKQFYTMPGAAPGTTADTAAAAGGATAE